MYRLKEVKEKGQVLVESAIVFPLMIFFTLGIMQLTMLQQGRIMVDYAAYSAARSGVVHNGAKNPMEAAANIAMLGFQFPTNDIGPFFKSYVQLIVVAAARDAANNLIDKWTEGGGILGAIASLGMGIAMSYLPPGAYVSWARVFIVNPKVADFGGEEEIDFDCLPGSKPACKVTNKNANILTVAVNYDFELKIGFVNWVMFEAWYGVQTATKLSGAIWSTRVATPGGFGASNAMGADGANSRTATVGILSSKGSGHGAAVYEQARRELNKYWIDSQTQNRYAIPLYGSYSMRMHSNIFKKYVTEMALPNTN